MMKKLHTNILERLDLIIKETANHIHDFIDSKSAFTRKRKLDAFDDDSQLMSASAYVQQKSKLSPQCFIHILQSFNNQLIHIRLLDHKYRLFAIDGSDFDQLGNPNSKNKVTKQSPRPFCQIHVNAMYNLLNNTYQDCIFQPKAHMNERTAAVQLLKHLNVGQYIVMMDRGYTSFNLIENCNRLNNCFYVVRTKTGQGAMKEIRAMTDCECDRDISCKVTISGSYYMKHKNTEKKHLILHYRHHYKKYFSKNTQDASWDFEKLCTVKFRACKVRINDPDTGKDEWKVLLTNLNRQEFPLPHMKKLYHLRWGIESSFRKLKYDLGCIQFHSKQDNFIEMEIYAHMIMFNTVSQINAQAYVPQRHCQYTYIINFKMSCRIIHKQYNYSSTDTTFLKILRSISRYTVPVRPGRKDKRYIKVKAPVCFLYRVA